MQDARKEHYYLGFDKSTFKPSGDQTFNFQRSRTNRPGAMTVDRISQSLNVSLTGSNQQSKSTLQAHTIANKQKQCHIVMGGAPSNQKST